MIGTAMGTRVAPTFASLFIGFIETEESSLGCGEGIYMIFSFYVMVLDLTLGVCRQPQ